MSRLPQKEPPRVPWFEGAIMAAKEDVLDDRARKRQW